MNNFIAIPTYIINLVSRPDRKGNILQEFEGRDEFNVTIVKAIKHDSGAMGLWETIKYILRDLALESREYVLICEDDHEFTACYSKEILFQNIERAKKLGADVLCGGVSWFNTVVPVDESLFWVETFNGTQFIIVFKKFWEQILKASFTARDSADYKMCSLSDSIFLIAPFISIQKDYGYSDATSKNNVSGKIKKLFQNSTEGIHIVKKIIGYYTNVDKGNEALTENFDSIVVPVYAINLSRGIEEKLHIEKQFAGKNEFDLNIIDACQHEITAYGLWMSIRKVIEMAIANDDDVIIICMGDHEFAEFYTKQYLLSNIVEAHEQGVCYLSGGGTIKPRYAVQTAPNRYWVSDYQTVQFVVLYKNIFARVLNEPFDEKVIADIKLSGLTSNKMILYPSISMQKDFDYVRSIQNQSKRLISKKFEESNKTMERIREAYKKYQRR